MDKPETNALGMRPKLSERVADELRERIQAGDLKPGVQLPTEGALVEQFGVSRTVIREAVSSLRVDGLVKSHQGRGVFVANDISQQPFRLKSKDLSKEAHMQQAMELRLHLEVTNAELAAVRRTQTDMDHIEETLQKHHLAHQKNELGQVEDFSFHLAVANATGNSYMVDFLRFLGPLIIPANALRSMVGEELSSYQDSIRMEHLAIADAIKLEDREAAGTAMRKHILRGLSVNSAIRES